MKVRVAVPCDEDRGLNSPVSSLFGRAPYFLIADLADGKITSWKLIRNPYFNSPGGAGPMAIQFLYDQGVNVIVASMIGPNAQGALLSLGISYKEVSPGIPADEAIKSVVPKDDVEMLRERKRWIEERLKYIEARLRELSFTP